MINQYEIIALNNGVASIDDAGNSVDLKEGGLSLDTYGDFDVSLNYQIDDILDIKKRNTSFSKTIKLPGTPTNNRFFKSIYDVNIDVVYFNPAKRIPVVVRVGASDVMTGFMQLMSIKIDNGEINYDVSIAGSFKDIISTISDYNMDILDMSEYNHTRNQATIVSSWNYDIYKWSALTNVQGTGEGYVYPYIINGNSDDIWDTTYIYDMFPAFYVKTIMDKLMDFAGYTYTSEFFETEYFKKLIQPYAGDKIQISADEEFGRTVKVGVTNAVEDATTWQRNGWDWYYNNDDSWRLPFRRESGTVTDNGNDLEFSDEYGQWYSDPYSAHFTCAETGFYDIETVCHLVPRYLRDNGNDIQWNGGEFEWRWQLILYRTNGTSMVIDSSYDPADPANTYGVLYFSPSDGDTHSNEWNDIDSKQTISANGTNVLLETGDIIRLRIGFHHPSSLNWKGTDTRMYAKLQMYQQDTETNSYSKFTVVPSSNDSVGNDAINMNQILDSNMKMKDWFLDIIKMFNLVVQDNPNKINDLIIEPRDDFFKSRQRVLNWDEELKLDNDSEVKITPMSELDAKSYLFTYKKDDDFYNKEYTSETQRTYGDYEIAIQNDFSDKVNKMEIGFSPTPDASTYINGRIAPYFVEADGENFKPKKVKRRILFYGGPLPCEGFSLKDFPGQAGVDTTWNTTYPYVGMWDHPTNPKWDLGFGRTDKIYWNTSLYPNNNLYEQFHKQTMQNIIDLNSKLLECTVHLTPEDIADFDFRDIVFLLGSYWRVNKIKDYNPVQTDRLTKVVLYKIIDLDVISPEQVSVPVSNQSCPTDMISKKGKLGWITVSASGQEVTEDCCKSVGGIFTQGVCVLSGVIADPDHPIKYPPKNHYIKSGGLTVAPTSDSNGPVTNVRNNTSRNNLAVTTIGSGNYVPGGSEGGFIMGDNNTIASGVKGTFIIGDGISATESGALYIGDIKIGQDGNITTSGINIIDGGEDEVFNFDKTNLIDIIDGSEDDVRTPGGDSKERPIIDGGTPQ